MGIPESPLFQGIVAQGKKDSQKKKDRKKNGYDELAFDTPGSMDHENLQSEGNR
jgi:hypothetical protein